LRCLEQGGVITIATRGFHYLRDWLNCLGILFGQPDNTARYSRFNRAPEVVATVIGRSRDRNLNLLLSLGWCKGAIRPGLYPVIAGNLVEPRLPTSNWANPFLEMDSSDVELSWDRLCQANQFRHTMVSDLSDQELIWSITGGDPQLFAELVNRYQKKIAALIYSLISVSDEVEDIAQDVFITVYQNLSRFEHRSSFSTWIYRITVNKCHDWQRRNYRRKAWFKPWDDGIVLPAVTMDNAEDYLMVRQQVSGLPDKYRLVIVLYYYHGLKCHEIAGILEVPPKTVETRLFRARKLLAAQLGRGDGNAGNQR